MIKFLKSIVPINVKRYYWRYLRRKAKAKKKRIKFDGKSRKETFTFIYDTNYWSGTDSISGGGSSLHHTQVVIKSISSLIKKMKLKSVLDIPCGDFAWMQYVDLSTVNYIGGDIVEDLIKENKKKFVSRKNVAFELIDMLHDDLPESDILINRDCLVHFSFHDIYKAIENLKKSNCKYFLTTTFPNHDVNIEITTGEWRMLNLEKPPFNFKPPMEIFSEECKTERFSDKCMAMWNVKEIELPEQPYNV